MINYNDIEALPDTSVKARLQRLETMLMIRALEQRLIELQRQGAPGSCSSIGQEACAVGVVTALDERDRILSNHRSAGHLLARGAEPRRLIAEVLGRTDGYCRGHSGTLHISVRELGIVLTSTIVGAGLSMAPGVALAQKMGHGEPGGIAAVIFGDGAACEGIFHEALNLAVHWQLPLLFVCENNQWQAYVHRRETMADRAIETWARGHGLPVQVVDGNDVEAVYAATVHAVAEIRASGKPQLLELVTYRLRGHFEPDDQSYVDSEELARWRERDPVHSYAQQLLENQLITTEGLIALQDHVEVCIDEAVAFAQASPWPTAQQLTEMVYA